MQFKYLKNDLYRYFYPNDNVSKIGFMKKMKIIVLTQGIWALIVYRFTRWLNFECKSIFLKGILKPVQVIANILIEITTGIKIWAEADIGPGLYIGHFGNIFIGPTIIGKFCNISQENSIGFAGRKHQFGLPEVGDFVYIAPGAKIIGKIKIGNHVAIGANAVVTKNLPDFAVAVGVPAKIISYKSSRDLIQYNKDKSRGVL